MTDLINDIEKAVAYEIIVTMGDDGLNALLTADDLLSNMAVPVTQFDFTYANRSNLKKLMISVEKFLKSSKLTVNSYTKAGLQSKFENLWIPSLSNEEKERMIAEYRLVDGFDADGYAIFNQKAYTAWKGIFDKGQIPRFKYKVPQFGKGSTSIELIDDRPFTIYKAADVDGYWCAPLDISVDMWCKIIKGATVNIKRMLQCYLQVEEKNRRVSLYELEKRFGIKWESFNSCNTALGRRAQRMLNFTVVDTDDETRSRYWSTAMTKGREENGLWVWEPRPELMAAAEIVLREENFPKVKVL